MCTVSFVNHNGSIFITSNRDETVVRPSALPPQKYILKNKNIIFPKDPKAGGTWFAVDTNGTVLVLLNGAAEKHEVALAYRKSRGLIVLEIMGSLSPRDFWDEIDLKNIEPFTLVLFQNSNLFQLRWDGTVKQEIELDNQKNHVWSSATLYTKEIRDARAMWFHSFLNNSKSISQNEMLNFHEYTEKGNFENGLVINRNDTMKTLSITQVAIRANETKILYRDLIDQKDFETSLSTI